MKPDYTELRRLLAAYPDEEWDCGLVGDNFASYLWVKTHHAPGDPDAPDSRFGEALAGRAALIAAMRNALPGLLDAVERGARLAAAARELPELTFFSCANGREETSCLDCGCLIEFGGNTKHSDKCQALAFQVALADYDAMARTGTGVL